MAVSKSWSNRYYQVSPVDSNTIGVIGTASTPALVGTWSIQFDPSSDFVGLFVMMGHVRPPGPSVRNGAFMPIPYRRITVNNVASDWTFVSDAITGPSIIQVPSNGMSVGIAVICTAGSCGITMFDMNGPSAV